MEFNLSEQGFTTTTEFGLLEISSDANYGHRPIQLLISSIAVCSGGIFKTILDKKRILYQDIKIRADITQSEVGVKKITHIHLLFNVYNTNASNEVLTKVLKLTTKYCPVVQSVKESIHITETVEKNN